ncbi:MAG: alcohol dehydrogenase [Bacteroidetes bacterium]|nr:MAG: alcohol dehydrogenase [Bacteroidota bacterium]
MNILVCRSPRQFEFISADMPVPKRDMALLQMSRVGICGTDLHAFEGTQPFFEYPRILGHELAGVLVSNQDIPGYDDNESVTILPYFNCGSCLPCLSGKENCCEKLQVCGVHVDGGMRDFFQVPINSLIKAEGLTMDELALVEPLSIGAHAIRRAGIKRGEFVLIAGAGPIGMATAAFAQIAGAQVILMDVNAARLRLAKSILNLKYLLDSRSRDSFEQLREWTGGSMPQVIMDATGNLKAIESLFPYIAFGGRFVLVGLQKEKISFSHPEFHKREATLMSSRNATREDFSWVIQCIRQKLVSPNSFITHRIPFAKLKDIFPDLNKPELGVLKAVVEFD